MAKKRLPQVEHWFERASYSVEIRGGRGLRALAVTRRGTGDSFAYSFKEADVSSTSLINAGRAKLAGSTGGVFVADGGGTYPSGPFVAVLALGRSNPCARSIAIRSVPGPEDTGGYDVGTCCGCEYDAWVAGGVDVLRWAVAIMSARFLDERRACRSPGCGVGPCAGD